MQRKVVLQMKIKVLLNDISRIDSSVLEDTDRNNVQIMVCEDTDHGIKN